MNPFKSITVNDIDWNKIGRNAADKVVSQKEGLLSSGAKAVAREVVADVAAAVVGGLTEAITLPIPGADIILPIAAGAITRGIVKKALTPRDKDITTPTRLARHAPSAAPMVAPA